MAVDPSDFPKTCAALEKIREETPEALDADSRKDYVIVASKLGFNVEEVLGYVKKTLVQGNLDATRVHVLDPVTLEEVPRRLVELIEEYELFKQHIPQYRQNSSGEWEPCDSVTDAARVPINIGNILFVENQIMGPVPTAEELVSRVEAQKAK